MSTPRRLSDTERRSGDARSAGIGALVAALITAAIGYFGIWQQMKAEDERSSSEFVREQRQAAYAAFVLSESELTRHERDFQELLADDSPVADVVNKRDEIELSKSKLEAALSNVALVGSKDAALLATEVNQTHSGMLSGIYGTVNTMSRGEFDEVHRPEVYEDIGRSIMDTDAQRSDFLDRARLDVIGPDSGT